MTNYTLPENGRDKQELLGEMQQFRKNDPAWKKGKVWSLVYRANEEHTNFLKEAYTMYFSENGLNPIAFKSLKNFEHQVVRMSANLMGGDENTVGVMTSGGTESIMLAIKTYRDKFRSEHKFAGQAEMIIPRSAHVAFIKAAHYFDVKIRYVDVTDDYRMDVDETARKINKRTMLIVGSAPCYPFGVIDPIEELAALARLKKVPLHVDACVGGFMLPFVEKLGHNISRWNFKVEGVTSMSADVHKYGYAAKGASVIMYSSMDYMQHQMFIEENFPGGIFASPGMLGTRPGGGIAAAWASMQTMGVDGYTKHAKIVMDTTQKIIEGVNGIEGLEIMGKPDMCLLGYKSTDSDVNIYAVADIMESHGWHIDRQQKPECLHVMVNPLHENVIEEYIGHLTEAVATVKANPKMAYEGSAAMYGMIAKIPARGMIRDQVMDMMKDMYGPEGKIADMNEGGAESFTDKAGKAFLKVQDGLGKLKSKFKK